MNLRASWFCPFIILLLFSFSNRLPGIFPVLQNLLCCLIVLSLTPHVVFFYVVSCQNSTCCHLSCQNSSRCPLLLSELLVVYLVLSELHSSPLSCKNSISGPLVLSELFRVFTCSVRTLPFFTCPVRTLYVFHLFCQISLRFHLSCQNSTFFTCPARTIYFFHFKITLRFHLSCQTLYVVTYVFYCDVFVWGVMRFRKRRHYKYTVRYIGDLIM
jgi:hypothetical protein